MDSFDILNGQEGLVHVVDLKNIPKYISVFNENSDNDLPLADMTSLGDLLLLGKKVTNQEDETKNDDDIDLSRISLAYEKLEIMPRILIDEFGPTVKILDISNNQFANLDFLAEFQQLTSLICDRNNITSESSIPYMPQLELLWLNNCKIRELHQWAKKLKLSCPNLKFLSLMGNVAAPSYFNGGSVYEYINYRLYVISLFPRLVHLDDAPITEQERIKAEESFPMSFIEKMMIPLPEYIKEITEKLSDFLKTSPRLPALTQRNAVI